AASRMLCIGHRGIAALYPENTLPSLVAALDQGADGIELDIRLTLDNEVIVMHDPTLDRSTNATGNVRDWTWDRMQREGVVAKKTHLGYGECFGEGPAAAVKPEEHKDAGPKEAPIPRLVDVLDMLVEYPREWDNPLSIMTHLHTILTLPRYTALLPRITLGIWSPHFIFSLPPTSLPVKRSFIGSNLTLARLCSRAVDTFSLDMDVVLANPDWVRARKAKGYTITTWTVDGEAKIANVMAQGLVDGIITDCVGQCLSVRD
ncbi:PLC-like phosphodiesterase, partial [Catenaria anguillulae PL171]